MLKERTFDNEYEDISLLDSILNPVKSSSMALTTAMSEVTDTLVRYGRREEAIFDETVALELVSIELKIAKMTSSLVSKHGYTKAEAASIRNKAKVAVNAVVSL